MTVQIQGINLERLLREAQDVGIVLRCVRRTAQRSLSAKVDPNGLRKLKALCAGYGWEIGELRPGLIVGVIRFFRGRPALAVGAALCLLLIRLSCEMVLSVHVTGAQEYTAEVHRILREEGAVSGRLKRGLSTDALSDRLMLSLPGLTYAGLRFSGSVLVADVRLAGDGELILKPGEMNDLVASQPGIVTRIVVSSGTPVVAVGDAVYAGQVLVKGEERSGRGLSEPVKAQAQVYARVWASGEARAALTSRQVTQTGRVRRRVEILTPWFTRVVCSEEPFEHQVTEVVTERVIDLFIPLIRRTQTYNEITVSKTARNRTDAASDAQGAAEKLAKKQLPPDVLILDKWVDYSMIDNEFLYASVVLEYEQDIAVRAGIP